MQEDLNPTHTRKVQRRIREEYSLEDEVRILRRMTAYLFQHVTHTMSEYELKRMQSHPDAKEFWEYFESVENILRSNPDPQESEDQTEQMSRVHQDIADTLTDSSE